ncbi:hypothetical protein BJV82DRAFT_635291 [Fennellomyces sp. T-0311]|nr:hypothetical protein BJV82DRAFT_635291 [Fennellomyces sp. T-0311]
MDRYIYHNSTDGNRYLRNSLLADIFVFIISTAFWCIVVGLLRYSLGCGHGHTGDARYCSTMGAGTIAL